MENSEKKGILEELFLLFLVCVFVGLWTSERFIDSLVRLF